MKIGLIGSGIGRSSSPFLHKFLGDLYGVEVDYRIVDSNEIQGFQLNSALNACAAEGFRGVNVTHPFKAAARAFAEVDDPLVVRIGAINTVTFDPDGWHATNTDFSGFIGAYRHRFGSALPGISLIIGTGGVGKAIAFSLIQLGAEEIWLYDIDSARAEGLARILIDAGITAVAVGQNDLLSAMRQADGLINGTPIGMWTNPGNPFPMDAIGGQRWAFDAVYTPMETEFLLSAKSASLEIMGGYDLLLFQGFDAFEIFSGRKVDPAMALAKMPSPGPDENSVKVAHQVPHSAFR